MKNKATKHHTQNKKRMSMVIARDHHQSIQYEKITTEKKFIYTTPFTEHLKSPTPAFCVKIVNDVGILTGTDPKPLPNTTTR